MLLSGSFKRRGFDESASRFLKFNRYSPVIIFLGNRDIRDIRNNWNVFRKTPEPKIPGPDDFRIR